MDNETNNIQEEKSENNTEFTKPTTYDFDKNSFIVEPVFKEQAAETLGTVFIRLMKSDK
ncbi:MAG: hypothetical protein ACI4A5_05440 [Hominilimicola sp.]